ncbi:MAG: hypothetical protein SWO11_16290 [Thermodesulfobacteriota bacterium]|nr:hypothetical protein [Thermodesulfobacteriota bacterium]
MFQMRALQGVRSTIVRIVIRAKSVANYGVKNALVKRICATPLSPLNRGMRRDRQYSAKLESKRW